VHVVGVDDPAHVAREEKNFRTAIVFVIVIVFHPTTTTRDQLFDQLISALACTLLHARLR
jgi:hypothetical protein